MWNKSGATYPEDYTDVIISAIMFIIIILVTVFVILLRTGGVNTVVDEEVYVVQANDALVSFLKTPVLPPEGLVGQPMGNLEEAKKFLKEHPEIYEGKNFGEFINELYFSEKIGRYAICEEAYSLFKDSVVDENGEPFAVQLIVQYPPENDVSRRTVCELHGGSMFAFAQLLPTQTVPLSNGEIAWVRLYVGR